MRSLLKESVQPLLEVIDEVPDTEWIFWEQYYISLFKSWGFKLTNATAGGEGMVNCSPETRLKMRQAKLGKTGVLSNKSGKKISAEGVKRMCLAQAGKTMIFSNPEERGRKISEWRKGKTLEEILGSKEKADLIKANKKEWAKNRIWPTGWKWTEEARKRSSIIVKEKMTEDRKLRTKNAVLKNLQEKKEKGIFLPQSRKVNQIDKDTKEVIKMWNSCREAEDALLKKKTASNVWNCAAGNQPTAYGFIWEFNNM